METAKERMEGKKKEEKSNSRSSSSSVEKDAKIKSHTS